MATQGTDNLVIVDNMPSVEKLWNGRYRLEFFCKIQNPNEGWYSDSIDNWLPEFGALQDADFAGEGWSARDGEAYPDMRLVKCEAKYIAPSETHLVTLTYETLTASWVAEKDEDIDYELNGLQRVSRTFVALPETSYTKVVGTSTITVGGDTLTLGAFKIEETDSMWSLTETWLESGELSRSENLESGNESISITNIGDCPTAPAGYTAVNQEERDTQGFPTCSITFYKDNSVLSRSNDYVGSQLAETIEVFNPTSEPTPTNGGVLANESVSNVDGIPTTRYTFLVPSVLSESTDNVGSQLAKVIEAFDEIPATPSGYVLANEQESDVEGIPTKRFTFLKDNVKLSESEDRVGSQLAKVEEWFNPTTEPTIPQYVIANIQKSDIGGIPTERYTFLKPSILSVSQQFIGGSATVQVQAFDKTSAEVGTALSEVTASHVLISEGESDYEGIKTSSYTYEVDDFEVAGQTEDGFETLSRTELSADPFTNGDIGIDTYSSLYLATENIDNGGTIKIRKSKWSAHGVISIRPIEGEGFSLAPSYTYVTLGAPASNMPSLTKPDGSALGSSVTWFEPSVQNIEGLPTYSQDVLTSPLSSGDVQVDSYEKFFTITDPGVMSTGGAYNSEATSGGAVRYPEAISQPQTYRKKATVDVYLTTSSGISETEVAYSERNIDWCSIAFDNFYNNEKDSSASVSANWRSFPQYLNSSGTTDTSDASTLGEYFAEANSHGSGDTSYPTTGIYRVEITKYQRKIDATQLYLRTVITF